MTTVYERQAIYAGRRTSSFNLCVPSDSTIEDRRVAYTYEALQQAYPLTPSEVTTVRRTCCHRLGKSVYRFFPILEHVRNYESASMSDDITAGLLVGFLHVPQGLAYALLAHLPPISGLYTSLVPTVIYTIFGTSIHTSMGANSIVSLITADMVERELARAVDNSNSTQESPHSLEKFEDDFKLGLAMASTFVSGILFLAMGVFRFGFLTSYFSTSFVGGFTTAAAFHIVTSQVPKALNVKVGNAAGWWKVTKTYAAVYDNIENTHPIDLSIVMITLVLILVFYDYINPRLKPKLSFDVPINLVVVIIGTMVSYEFNLGAEHGVAIIGDIPVGSLPTLAMPDLSTAKNVIGDSVVMVMVTFSLNISMAILIGRIHHMEINPNRELIAYGMCNLLASPFPCHVSSTSPARCMMLHNDNARSVFHSIPTFFIILSVILGLGHFLQHLPIAVLAAVVFVAVRGLLAQCKQLPNLWRVNRADFVIWTSTFLVTAFVDIGVGLVFGIAASFAGIVITNQLAEGSLLVKAKHEDIFLTGENRNGVEHLPNIRIFRFPSQLCFFNANLFKSQLFQKVLNPNVVQELNYEIEIDSAPNVIMVDRDQVIRCIILDCSAMTHIDMDGINMLKLLVLMYHKAAVQLLMVRCLDSTYNTLERAGFFTVLPKRCVFYDLVDALRHEQYTREGVTLLTKKSTSYYGRLSIDSTITSLQ